MYVRWKKQKRSKKVDAYYFIQSSTHPQLGKREACLLTAYLVENTRIDGKPKQKILSYLGSINDAKIINSGANEVFWKSVDTHLKALNLKRDQRADIEQKLQLRVPKMRWQELYEISRIADRHPHARSHKEKQQLEELRKRYSLPGDEIRPL